MLPCTHTRRSSGSISFILVVVIFYLLWQQQGPGTVQSIKNFSPSSFRPTKLLESFSAGSKQSLGTENATLGFEAIFAVSPWRTWRSEGLILAANRTNLSITIPPQAPPSQPEVDKFMATAPDFLNEGSARAWLGHIQVLNAARKYSSVLIFEDDADWDIKIHEQAKNVASAVRQLSSDPNTNATDPALPWGDNWDVLWLGHCGERLPFPEEIDESEAKEYGPADDKGMYPGAIKSAWDVPKRRKMPDGTKREHDPYEDDYIIINDTSLPETITGFDARIGNGPPFTRWIQYAAGPVCTFAYAVNRKSVVRMLDELEQGHAQAFDMWLHTRCRGHDLRCFSVNPELFHHHVPAAASNLQHSLVNTHMQDQGSHNYTANVKYSARCNWDKGDHELVSCIEH